MRVVSLLLVLNLTSMVCALGAVRLAYMGIEGWGWFLVVTVLCATTSVRSRDIEEE